MAKGPPISDEVRVVAARIHEEHPKWTNDEIRNWVLGIVHKKNPSLPKDWPSKSAIDRIMPGIREQVRQRKLNPDVRDEPWSIFTLREYPLPSEALPTILRLSAFNREISGHDLTIREAQWGARLHALPHIPVEFLWFLVATYTISERLCELTGAHMISTHALDLFIFFLLTEGQEVSPERVKKLLGEREQEIFTNLVKMGVNFGKEGSKLDYLVALFEDVSASKQKGVQNEREHKRSKNERRHKKTK